MTTVRRPLDFLRRVLFADAAISAASGLALLAGASLGGRLLGLPPALLRVAGASLLPFALGVVWLATRARTPRAGVWLVIALNALWAIDALALVFSGWVAPNAFGVAFLIAQAAVPAALAELEWIGLRRAQAQLAMA
jgi:hypothetical protein